jgi:multidrug efflux pump subunit AcrA (membrane-fusion protein)
MPGFERRSKSRDAAVSGKEKKSDADSIDNDKIDKATMFPSSEYVAHIKLGKDTLEIDGTPTRLAPGMAVTAEIKIGRRTVISYLLSPLARSTADAAHER